MGKVKHAEGTSDHLNLSSGQSIYYELIEGGADTPCLVFLHEGLGCVPMWRDFPQMLCRNTGCSGLVYDRAGYGRSSRLLADRTIHYMHEYALIELPEVLDALIPGRPFILVGHSDGGSISLIYGADQPPLLKGIVTEAAHVFVESETIEGIGRADEAFEGKKLEGLKKYHEEKTRQMFKAWSDTWLSAWFRSWNIEYLLPAINCPMLVIQGMDDRYGTENQVHSIVLKSSGPAEFFLVQNCGHTPHLEQPEIVADKISGFIKKILNNPQGD